MSGEIAVNSSKNAAVALLIASLMNRGRTTLTNVPQIEEINRLVEVLESVGVTVEKEGRSVSISHTENIDISGINTEAAKKTRSIIMMIGALAGTLKNYVIPQAGGCRLGNRTVRPHVFALENFGIHIAANKDGFAVTAEALHPAKKIVLYESGDTVTENALMVAAQAAGKTTIHFASANYMVQDLCFFLEKLGVSIHGIGTTTLEIEGIGEINKDVEYEISEDPIEAMFFLSLAIMTKSEILIQRCPIDFVELELLKLEKMGFLYDIKNEYFSRNGRTRLVDILTHPSELTALEEKIYGRPFPGINIDNLPFFVPIATQVKGLTLIHDWVYENRAIYFVELNRLGAKVTLLDPHRVYIEGPTELKGREMISPPALRPAAIILVAMLGAKGKSMLREVYEINRGYEKIEERLKKLGADIELIKK